jgi:hypothetical protein
VCVDGRVGGGVARIRIWKRLGKLPVSAERSQTNPRTCLKFSNDQSNCENCWSWDELLTSCKNVACSRPKLRLFLSLRSVVRKGDSFSRWAHYHRPNVTLENCYAKRKFTFQFFAKFIKSHSSILRQRHYFRVLPSAPLILYCFVHPTGRACVVVSGF